MLTAPHRIIALIVAAGSGTRAHNDANTLPKQYQHLSGEPLLARTLRAFISHPAIDAVQVVVRSGDESIYTKTTQGLAKLLPPVSGGATRQASAFNGLQAIRDTGCAIVLIHDAARPFVSHDLIMRSIAAAEQHGAAVPGVPVVDTLVRIDDGFRHTASVDRDHLRALQTPQAFAFATVFEAHQKAAEAGRHDFTDDGAVAAYAGHRVNIIEGEAGNIKMTTAEDFSRIEREQLTQLQDIRVGQGFDVHAFAEGDHVILGGIAIPHAHGLSGHSDADVGLHALTDAIFGALADGDIGTHFPPSDMQWKGADSAQFLAYAAERVRARGGIIAHLDLTLIGERPKIGPYHDAIRQRIAEIVGISPGRVGVKATTTEKLGFTGRSEGLAAQATATLRLP